MRSFPAGFFAVLAVAVAAHGLTAQAAASRGHFLVAPHHADGATSISQKFTLVGSLGDGVLARRATSSRFVLTGGFAATLDAPTTGRPWVTGVNTEEVTPRGGATVVLEGTALNLGTSSSVRVGGVAATVVDRTPHSVTAKLAFQPVPGRLPVAVTNGGGTSTLTDGLGVLPLLGADPAPAPNVPFDLVLRGTKGDVALIAVSIGTVPPIKISNWLFGLALDPRVMLVLLRGTITDASGELRIPLPASDYVRPLLLQAVFVTSDPGYAPASFSNVLRL